MDEDRQSTSRHHLRVVLQAVLVTFLWSTSWVLIKLGLQTSLPALTFAGLRYTLAFLCLAPFALGNSALRKRMRALTRAEWTALALLGMVFYSITQGAQFVGLAYLPAATLNLLLNFSPILVALAGSRLIQERPSSAQWYGILLCTAGAVIYFLPLNIPGQQWIGLSVGLAGLVANAGSSLLGRHINRNSGLPPILVTFISMGIGGSLLLACGGLTQGFGQPGPEGWLIIIWLAVVNTAAAFTLWNHTLRTLTATESSIINNTMMPQIAILAWVFLGESLTPRQIIGMALVVAGTLVVQLLRPDAPATGKGQPGQG
jgi:drug/metabolite transporter (DMT)-like permease